MLFPRNLLCWLSLTSLPTRLFAHCAVLDPLSGAAFLPMNRKRGAPRVHWAILLVAHSPLPFTVWWEEPFPLLGAHCAGVARAAFREAGRCGTGTAGVVLKLCAVHVRPLWVSVRSFHLHLLPGSCPLQNKTLWHTGWDGSLVCWRKPSVF